MADHPELAAMAKEAATAATKKPDPPGPLRLQLRPLVTKESSE